MNGCRCFRIMTLIQMLITSAIRPRENMRTTISMLCCLILFSCQKETSDQKQLSQDEYDVFSAVINDQMYRFTHRQTNRNDTVQYIVVYYKTIHGSLLASNDTNSNFTKYISPKELYELRTQFAMVSLDTLELNRQRMASSVKLITRENTEEWSSYAYTQGVNSFSRVGFNLARNMAIVYGRISSEWGSECLYLLKKEHGAWLVIDGLILSMDRYSLISDRSSSQKPSLGVPHPIPDATIQNADSTSERE